MSLFKIKTEIESLKGPYFLVSGSLSVPPNWSGVPDFGPDPDFFGKIGPVRSGFCSNVRIFQKIKGGTLKMVFLSVLT